MPDSHKLSGKCTIKRAEIVLQAAGEQAGLSWSTSALERFDGKVVDPSLGEDSM